MLHKLVVRHRRAFSSFRATVTHLHKERAIEQEQRVVVVDVNMKFGTMVVFLVKLAIAFIPAAIILVVVGFIVALLFGGLFSGISR